MFIWSSRGRRIRNRILLSEGSKLNEGPVNEIFTLTRGSLSRSDAVIPRETGYMTGHESATKL